MRRWCGTVVLCATAALAAADTDSFSPTLPDAVVDVSGWETVRGSFDTPQIRGEYLFHVNPERQGLYQVMRYRTSRAGGGESHLGSERVVFVRRPGAREPALLWEKQQGAAGWRALPPGTPAYRAEMLTLIRVLGLHRPGAAANAR